MKLTEKQRELLTMLIDNREDLEAIFKAAAEKQEKKRKQVKDLKLGESIFFAGIIWSKFAEDENGNALMLADKPIGCMEFGKSNDWKDSQIRNDLNGRLYFEVVSELGRDALIPIKTDLLSHDGLDDYGACTDKISLLTCDLYRSNRKNIKLIDKPWWLATPNSTPSGYGSNSIQYVSSGGGVDYGWHGSVRAVRPFFILKSSIYMSCNDLDSVEE